MNRYENTAEYYDYLCPINNEEVNFYKSYLKSNSTILEMGCGTGRINLILVKKINKIKFHCVDDSDTMLKIFKNKLNNINKNYLFERFHSCRNYYNNYYQSIHIIIATCLTIYGAGRTLRVLLAHAAGMFYFQFIKLFLKD